MTNTEYAMVPLEVVPMVRKYKPFEGQNYKQIQRLLNLNRNNLTEKLDPNDVARLIISPKQLMIACLGRIGSPKDTKYLISNYVDTSTAVLSDPSGDEVKYSKEHPFTFSLTPETELNNDDNLPLTQKEYDLSEGFTLSREQANALRNNIYAVPKVRREAWNSFADGDEKLVDDYINFVEQTTGYKFEKSAMGLYIPSSKGLRLLFIRGVVGFGKSDAFGDGRLGEDNGRLVGVATESQLVGQKITEAKKLEEKLRAI